MRTATKVAERIMFGSAGLALVLGVYVWISANYSLIDVHKLLGYGLVGSLWGLAWIAARSRVPAGIVGGAVAWGALVLALGWGQQYLLTGDWHWVVRVLHLVVSMASVPWGRRLIALIQRNDRSVQQQYARADTSIR